MTVRSDAQVLDAWSRNAAPWVGAVRGGEIASRLLVTNAAIVDAVRALPEVEMVGVDAIPGLVEAARAAGGGEFRLMSYEEIAQGRLDLAADVAVCNFSLIGKEAVEGLFRAAPSYLRKGGALIVQTVHPFAACGEQPYVDGWREGSWAGFSSEFKDAPPWYFRTAAGWVALFADHGLRIVEMREPVHPETGKPVSLILVGELQG